MALSAVASRLAIESAAFRRYALAGIATHLHRGDFQGGKGFQTLRLRTPAGPLALVNTHLHAQYHPDDRDPFLGHRTGQVVELAASLRTLKEPLVAAGDFNLREDQDGYRILTALTGLEDAAVQLDRREPTSSFGTRIDFVLTRGPRPRRVGVFAERGLLSDHAGVVAELEIASGRPPSRPDPVAVAEARALLAAGRADALHRRRLARAGVIAATATGAGALALRRVSRRRFLLGATAALALPCAVLSAMSAERWVSGEIEAFDRVAALRSSWVRGERRRAVTRATPAARWREQKRPVPARDVHAHPGSCLVSGANSRGRPSERRARRPSQR